MAFHTVWNGFTAVAITPFSVQNRTNLPDTLNSNAQSYRQLNLSCNIFSQPYPLESSSAAGGLYNRSRLCENPPGPPGRPPACWR